MIIISRKNVHYLAHNHSYYINKYIFLSPFEIKKIPIIDNVELEPKNAWPQKTYL